MNGNNINTFLYKVYTSTSKTISMKTRFAETFSYTIDDMAECIFITDYFCKRKKKEHCVFCLRTLRSNFTFFESDKTAKLDILF